MKVSRKLQPAKIPSDQARLAYTGFVYLSPSAFEFYQSKSQPQQTTNSSQNVLVQIQNKIFICQPCNKLQDNDLALNKFQREFLRLSLVENLDVDLYVQQKDQEFRLSQINFEIVVVQQIAQKIEIDGDKFQQELKTFFKGFMFNQQQQLLYDYQGNALLIKVNSLQTMETGYSKMINSYGQIVNETDIEITGKNSQTFRIKQNSNQMKSIFRSDFKFDEIGVGGLDDQLSNIFRRAFSSRRYPTEILEKYGIKHMKGLILYGPPGTGKTLIAKQLSQVLRCSEPKIVNGPEIMSKYVGEAEKNIRDLFQEATVEQKEQGDDSQLHIIIFDEMDAICKQRGSVQNGTGVYDSMVNQLLSMIDGVNSLNNVLVIGMTNRLDLLDEAMLRPGRFEVHIEVSLPDEKGREDIFKIHTKKMRENQLLSEQISLSELAKQTKNYTGAEIEGVVKSAASYSFNRGNDLMDFNKTAQINENSKIEMQDFSNALTEVKPQFGVDNDHLDILIRNQLINYGNRYDKIQNIMKSAVEQIRNGKTSQLHSVLLEGEIGTGKTAIAAQIALQCGFPFVKLISPEKYVGMTESQKVQQIVKIFMDAYRSPLACIIIDNIERLIEYISQGPRFSNTILQTLLVLIKKQPKDSSNKLLLIGTTSLAKHLKYLELISVFNLIVKVPALEGQSEISTILLKYSSDQMLIQKILQNVKKIAVKKLLFVIEMSLQANNKLDYNTFMESYDASIQNDMDDNLD